MAKPSWLKLNPSTGSGNGTIANSADAHTSQIWVGCNSWYWLLLWAAFLIYAITFVIKNWSGNLIWDLTACKSMFWIEVISLLTVYLTCLV